MIIMKTARTDQFIYPYYGMLTYYDNNEYTLEHMNMISIMVPMYGNNAILSSNNMVWESTPTTLTNKQ